MKIYSALYKDDAHLGKYGTIITINSTFQLTDPGILILHGGEDIATGIYGQEPGNFTYTKHPSKRDRIEIELVHKAIELNIPIFGICRGAQLLTALAGGSLVQDVTRHVGPHTITTNDGQQMEVTSAHHQMCNPTGTDHELLAWSTTNRSHHYYGEYDEEVQMDCEPEVIFYPKMKALAVQPHPEWMDRDSDFVQYLFKLIEEKLL